MGNAFFNLIEGLEQAHAKAEQERLQKEQEAKVAEEQAEAWVAESDIKIGVPYEVYEVDGQKKYKQVIK